MDDMTSLSVGIGSIINPWFFTFNTTNLVYLLFEIVSDT